MNGNIKHINNGVIKLTSKVVFDKDEIYYNGKKTNHYTFSKSDVDKHLKDIGFKLVFYDLWGVRYTVGTKVNDKKGTIITTVTPLDGEYEKYLDRVKKKLDYLEIFS